MIVLWLILFSYCSIWTKEFLRFVYKINSIVEITGNISLKLVAIKCNITGKNHNNKANDKNGFMLVKKLVFPSFSRKSNYLECRILVVVVVLINVTNLAWSYKNCSFVDTELLTTTVTKWLYASKAFQPML